MRYISILFILLWTLPVLAIENIAQHLQDVSVTIKSNRGSGSGIIITREVQTSKDDNTKQKVNFILTAGHVISSLRSVRTVIVDGEETKVINFRDASLVKQLVEKGRKVGQLEMECKVLKYSDADNGEDIALLMVRKRDFVSASVEFYLPKDLIPIGTQLFHVGSLLGEGGSNSMTAGIMSQVGRVLNLGVGDGVVFDQTSVTAFPGCVTADTRISMANGTYKKIIDIKPGETVLCYGMKSGLQTNSEQYHNKLRPVKRGMISNMIKSGIKKIYLIKTGNRSIKVSGNHPFIKIFSHKNAMADKFIHIPVWTRADELKEGDIVATIKSHVQFKKSNGGFNFNQEIGQRSLQDKKEFMEFLGFYIGDGYSRYRQSHGGEVNLYTFNEDDFNHYSKILMNLFEVNIGIGHSPSGTYINVSSVYLANKLKEWGVTGYSTTKRIPQWIYQIPLELQKEFLIGYVKADGHIRKNYDHWEIEASNKELVEDLWMMANHIGMKTSNISDRDRTSILNGRNISTHSWSCTIYPNSSTPSAQILGDSSNLPDDLYYEKIRLIKNIGEEMTYDLSIEIYHNFFANGYLLHNSSGGGVFFATGNNAGKYIGMLVRGSGENFNLIIPIRRMIHWAKTNKVEWVLNPDVPTPTLKAILNMKNEAGLDENKNRAETKPSKFPFLIQYHNKK